MPEVTEFPKIPSFDFGTWVLWHDGVCWTISKRSVWGAQSKREGESYLKSEFYYHDFYNALSKVYELKVAAEDMTKLRHIIPVVEKVKREIREVVNHAP